MQNAEKLQKSYGITVIDNLSALVRNWEHIAASKPPSDPGPWQYGMNLANSMICR